MENWKFSQSTYFSEYLVQELFHKYYAIVHPWKFSAANIFSPIVLHKIYDIEGKPDTQHHALLLNLYG